MDELRKEVWNEAMESTIGLFRKRHLELPSVASVPPFPLRSRAKR